MSDIFILLIDHEMQLRGDIATSLTSIAMIEGLVKQLDPELDMATFAFPYVAKLGLSEVVRLKNKHVKKDLQETNVEYNIDTTNLLADLD